MRDGRRRRGIRMKCSDEVDATGRHIWREDGIKDGRCCGIDFQQAAQKRGADNCHGHPVCRNAAIGLFVPFAHDAAIAMAHGLHRLLHQNGVSVANITADLLSQAMRESTFQGISGKVSFLKNGDRKPDHLEFVVYNYHASARNFQNVGAIKNDAFTPCRGAGCPRIIFSDGSDRLPNVQRRVSNHGGLCLFLTRRL